MAESPVAPSRDLNIRLDLNRIAWTSAALLFAGLPHFLHLKPWVPLFCATLIAWRLAIAHRQRPLPPRSVRLFVGLLGLAGVLFTYRTVAGLEAGTALLLVMGGAKLLETRNLRDLAITVFLAYFLVFAGFLYDQDLVRLPYMLIAVWVLTVVLLRLNQTGKPIAWRGGFFLAGKMLLQAVPVAALLFIVFPRLPGQFWALPSRTSGMTGLSDEMSPGDVSELSISGAIAFRVHFDGKLPPPLERYWRGPVLHDFDGRTWRRAQGRFLPRQELQYREPEYRYKIAMEPTQRRWLLALDVPTRWPDENVTRTADLQLVTRDPIANMTSYRLESSTSFHTLGALPAITRRADVGLPQRANPRTRELAQTLRAQSAGDVEYLQAILSKFRREEYFYTLEPPTLAADSVDDFLFNTRRGFCEHFASAFTALARAAGIPAHVVTGYQGGEYNEMGGYLIVRQSDAHAWSEVWLEGRGWVRYDPTAAVAPDRVERGIDAMADSEPVPGRTLRQFELANRLRLMWDAVNTSWNDGVVEFDAAKQRSFLEKFGIDDADWQTFGIAMVVTLAGFFAILSAYLAWQFRPRTRDPLVQIYRRLCRSLGNRSLPRHPHEGPTDYLGRVSQSRPDLAGKLEEIRSLYISLRYEPAPLGSEVSRFKYLVNTLRP
jgi:transglutaminase-like putative cysteine protease